MSGKKTTFPALPDPVPRGASLDLSLFLAKAGSVLLLSTPTSDCITDLETPLRMSQLDTGAVALASFARVSEDMKKSLTSNWPFSFTSSSLTLAIIIGMLMSTGQISLQRPQETHRCAKVALS